MALFDGGAEEPHSKVRRYVITVIVFIALVSAGVAYARRYLTEKASVAAFLDTLAKGDLQQAYRLWKPNASYSFQDFLSDWGPTGEFGPVKSYHIASAHMRKNASGVVITVELSRFAPFPSDQDFEKSRSTKEVRLWVERRDQAISFAP